MPRRSSGRSRSSSFSNKSRSHSTTSRAPSAVAHPPHAGVPANSVPQQRQPGLFGQMAATAGGVAVGSSIGHVIGNGISSIFGGGRQEAVDHEVPQYNAPPQYTNNTQHGGASCEADAKAFTKCMETNSNDIISCQFYLDMLKQCQAFSSQRF